MYAICKTIKSSPAREFPRCHVRRTRRGRGGRGEGWGTGRSVAVYPRLFASARLVGQRTWCPLGEERDLARKHTFTYTLPEVVAADANSVSPPQRLSLSSLSTAATRPTPTATPWLPVSSVTLPRSPAACRRPARRSAPRSSLSSRPSTTTT